MDNSQGGPGEDGAQGEPAEPEDAEKSRTYASRNGEPEPETPVVNGEKETSKGEPGTDEIRASDDVGDRDHRRPQEKKKAKGLGEQRATTHEACEGREIGPDIPWANLLCQDSEETPHPRAASCTSLIKARAVGS